MEPIIKVQDVSMRFNLGKEKVNSLKEYIIKASRRELYFDEFWALKNISFDINKGESVGILGLNGSGKSTLLKIISGVMKSTKGKVLINGTIAPLIELGAGFDSELSARENIFLNGAILGYSKQTIEKNFNDIVDFAELWDFIDVPIKNFSSGMVARLGFSIATINKSDIVIIDEILSVGDFKFQQKSARRIKELISGGSTVILVSHSIDQIKQMCGKVLWLRKGSQVMYSDAEDVCKNYIAQ